jgi:monovalent cation/hydrogen antiporter
MTLADGSPFPQHSAIVFITVIVVLLTIVGQGLMLPVIVRRFNEQENKSIAD